MPRILPALLLALSFATASAAEPTAEATAEATVEPARIVMVGTYHFSSPDQDMANVQAVDVTTPARQAVLLGSDYPQLSLAQTLDALERLDLDEDEKSRIRDGNARSCSADDEQPRGTAARKEVGFTYKTGCAPERIGKVRSAPTFGKVQTVQPDKAMPVSRRMIAVLLVGLAASHPVAPVRAADGARPDAKVIGAYFPGGEAARYPISRIPADRLTHLFYAFATIDEGRCAAPGAEAGARFAALAELKRRHPALRTLISIGGWNAGGFSDAASTVRSRRRFVASCMALFFDTHRGSFDGVDIDWEYPVYGGPPEIGARPQDRRNMTLLAREFRRQLRALGKQRGQSFLLTAALPAGRLQSAGPYDPARSYELSELAEVLDFINLMTYDMGTSFSAVSSFNAPLNEVAEDPLGQPMRRWNNVAGAIDYYRQQGVPAHKLVLGVPFYGRGFRVSSEANDGLYQPYTGTFDPGAWRNIKATLLPDPQWEQRWHPVAQSPWLFHRGERKFVSYEDPKSIAIRAQLARDRGLLGVFMWELAGDDEQHGLLEAMVRPFD